MSSDSRRRGSTPEAGRGLLFIVSAPSGAGKTTLVERLVELVPDLAISRSYTSRAARADEVDGVDYNFITRSRFEEMVRRGEFLEHADVFGNLYGTRAEDTERLLASGVTAMIDVSDGLSLDLSRLCGASGVGAMVRIHALPGRSAGAPRGGAGRR